MTTAKHNSSAQTPRVITVYDGDVSPDDSRFSDIRLLNHPRLRPDRQPRLQLAVHGEYVPAQREPVVLADGALPVARMCAADSLVAPNAVFGRAEKLRQFAAEYPSQWAAIATREIPVYELSQQLLREIVGFELHRGLLAVAARPAAVELGALSENRDAAEADHDSDPLAGARTVVVLEGVGDPDNIGAIFRSAASLGADAIVFGAGCFDQWDRRVVRVSMGQALRVQSVQLPGGPNDWHYGLEELRNRGFHVAALSPGSGSVELRDGLVDAAGAPHEKVALLLGAEGPGLSQHAMKAADSLVVIPMAAGADSLNVATTAACCLYERWRSMSRR